ncbi:unnamed protein product [Gongylonema pulchrum]|uniref:Transcriptional regulator n=1 Tax=Gongylonema pulchrum TaxID=637853 RepID=A0A183EYY6_9BILA|nr:unnamed protein product [Gongylonema pulchrum]
MTTTEQLKRAETMEEVLQILKITDYLPNFQSANIVQASALTLLKEADLKVRNRRVCSTSCAIEVDFAVPTEK